MKKIDNLLFVVGCHRSGTTLFRNILDKHEDIAVTPELSFFKFIKKNNFRQFNFREQEEKKIWLAKYIKKIIALSEGNGRLWCELSLDKEGFASDIYKSVSIQDVFFTTLRYTATKKEFKICVQKTPADVFYLALIRDLFPDAKIIQVVRDGREVVASARKKGWEKSGIDNAIYWLASLRAFERAKIGDNVLTIKYEDLCQRTDDTLKKVFKLISLPYESDDFVEAIKSLPSTSSFGEKNSGGIKLSQNFAESFSAPEKEEIETLLAKELIKYNYSAEKKKRKFSLILKAWLRENKIRAYFGVNNFFYDYLYKLIKKWL